jgi:hypothetical protein
MAGFADAHVTGHDWRRARRTARLRDRLGRTRRGLVLRRGAGTRGLRPATSRGLRGSADGLRAGQKWWCRRSRGDGVAVVSTRGPDVHVVARGRARGVRGLPDERALLGQHTTRASAGFKRPPHSEQHIGSNRTAPRRGKAASRNGTSTPREPRAGPAPQRRKSGAEPRRGKAASRSSTSAPREPRAGAAPRRGKAASRSSGSARRGWEGWRG